MVLVIYPSKNEKGEVSDHVPLELGGGGGSVVCEWGSGWDV